MKDEFIRDKIVCGITSDRVRKQLLKERALTLEKAIQIRQLNELSEDYGKQLSKHEADKHDVNYLKNKRTNQNQSSIQKCKSCGREHKVEKQACLAFKKQCHGCGKFNHFKKVCYSAKSPHTFQGDKRKKFGSRSRVDELLASNDPFDQEPFIIEIIESLNEMQNKKEIHCTTGINGREVQLKIDTGARCNVMALDLFRKVKDGEQIDCSKSVQLVAYGGHTFSTLGTVNINCFVNSIMYSLEFQIVDKPVASLLGLRDSLRMQ